MKSKKRYNTFKKILSNLKMFWFKLNIFFNRRSFIFRHVRDKHLRKCLVQTMKDMEKNGVYTGWNWYGGDMATSTDSILPRKHSIRKGEPDFDAIPKDPNVYREILAKYGLNFDEGITFPKDYADKAHRGKIPDFNK